ncbi:pre-16S rRNA-processing nuclease YqgF [Chamaesiphon minutus]|uniref:Putative endonuclease involved in recombination n=1 Tax=Chamaesiphon minutus (strain ATCC 27169 / PCC 6605) TaxID=1173020 RepID=K9UHN3_CHAP6|nr:pre-16S rRNA-processing nuclease YqgF [Chamaesiphon minutus]AFY94295.1 putative endonuclease involved in recombination [Chamaesiphon minutus PCC 6605]
MTDCHRENETILGFDPGKDKCGVAVMNGDRALLYHQVLLTAEVISQISNLCQQYNVSRIVMGDQTTAKQWQRQLTAVFPNLPITLVDERYSSLQARDRYWQMYPPNLLTSLIPQGMRQPPRPIDDLVAIILVERYLSKNPDC